MLMNVLKILMAVLIRTCVNSVGSYLCSRNSGFALASDKLGCDGKQAKNNHNCNLIFN